MITIPCLYFLYPNLPPSLRTSSTSTVIEKSPTSHFTPTRVMGWQQLTVLSGSIAFSP